MNYATDILRNVRQQRVLHDVTLELTYNCNLDCFYCYNDREKPGKLLALEQYEILLDDLAGMQTLFLMLTGGEPMIHPHFFDIARMARDKGFVVRVRTNGHNLHKRHCERLRDEVEPYMVEVSLHGATASVHDRQTRVPGSFNRLLKNLETAKQHGLRCSVVTTPTAWNEHQIEAMFALCDKIGLPLRTQGPVAPRDNGDTSPLAIQPSEKTWDIVERVVAERESVKIRRDLIASSNPDSETTGEQASTCSVGVAGVDIDPFGNVQACMHLQESAGNLHEQSIETIWNDSPLFHRARQASIEAAQQFDDQPIKQYGAPLYCIAVEENANKGCSACHQSCE